MMACRFNKVAYLSLAPAVDQVQYLNSVGDLRHGKAHIFVCKSMPRHYHIGRPFHAAEPWQLQALKTVLEGAA